MLLGLWIGLIVTLLLTICGFAVVIGTGRLFVCVIVIEELLTRWLTAAGLLAVEFGVRRAPSGIIDITADDELASFIADDGMVRLVGDIRGAP